MTGVEGYLESAASGMVAGINAAFEAQGEVAPDLTEKTAIGALGYYVSRGSNGRFDPMNVNFGIIAPLDKRVKGGKKAKNEALSARALEIVDEIAAELASKA
jgi:methylenetetrahydrofolate--tRNA-(uracil-5-)-methyltransferase